jgi:anti-sigma B factor antagonist
LSPAGTPNDGLPTAAAAGADESRPDAMAVDRIAIETEHSAEGLRLLLRGDLDLATAREFEHRLEEASRKTRAAITVDLTGLSFLDSRGLRAILGAQQLCDERGCRLTVIPGEQAQRLFDLTGLSERLPLADAASPRKTGA